MLPQEKDDGYFVILYEEDNMLLTSYKTFILFIHLHQKFCNTYNKRASTILFLPVYDINVQSLNKTLFTHVEVGWSYIRA